ncbi:hypothetical protein GCM10023340_22520 [Nocardioides marinquilinus]|uniref:Uncharacterized protein n=1 Tax=Nocardioides marinquilinus TaxID=1210400 RepID=A0ABP9PLH0_9ACTN
MPRTRLIPATLATAVTAVVAAAVLAPLPSSQAAPAASPAPATDGVWTPVDEAPRASRDGLQRRVDPSDYAGYHLDLGALEQRLDAAPNERRAARGADLATISVPSPDGELIEFAVAESPVLEAGLAAAHPEITTWAGSATGDAPATIRLDVTPMGFHASVRGPGATWYVDPAYNGANQGDDALYLSYLGSDLPERQREVTGTDVVDRDDLHADGAGKPTSPSVGEGGGQVAIQRTYRLALISDPSYAAAFSGNTTAEKTTLINRVNQVYGDDLSIRLLLVSGTDQLNFDTAQQFTGANGRCGQLACFNPTLTTDGCYSLTADQQSLYVLDQARYVAGQLIGADSYDIGHVVFGADGDGGGVAGLGVVGTFDKAAGCTGLAPPTGDGFAIDYVAHEVGHQFAGNHTFNGTSGSCADDNREATTSVEPGSGVSVMAYAGICGIDNLQSHSDPIFSQRSQAEIAAFTRGAPGNDNEVQNIALSGFGSGESFTISYGGAAQTVTSGTNYTAAGIKTAVEAAEPSSATATVTGLWGLSTSLTNGFQITWSGTADIAKPAVTVASGTFTPIVGTTDNGGAEDNQGSNNPTPTGNRNPTVTAPAAKTIPIRTPFVLTGSATDPEGDTLTYSWEQNDVGGATGTALNNNTKTVGPLFRIFGTYAAVSAAGSQQTPSPGQNVPGTSPTRSFPDLAQVAEGATNAKTGTCGTLSGTATSDSAALRCYSEFLPRVARSMSFRLTARDLGGADGGFDGGTSFADVTITAAGTAPFQITSQGTASSVSGNATGTVAWDVVGTDLAPYSVSNVKISLSTDGGLTYPTVLLASTPNDGSQAVTWPNVATSQGRIKVEAIDNYFYDLNDANITITPVTAPTPTLTTGGNAAGQTFTAASSDPLGTTPTITATSNTVAGNALTASATGLPTGLTLAPTSSTGDSRTFTVTGTADVDPGTYPVTVTVSDGAGNADDQTVSFTVVVTKDAAALTYTGDTTSQGGTVNVSASVVDGDATPGTVTGSVAFTDQTTGDQLCTATVASGTAACTFQAPADRTYAVVGTLTSTRYQGASAPATLVVDVPAQPTLTVEGDADGATYTVASSDVLIPSPTWQVTSNTVEGGDIDASWTGLPTGLDIQTVDISPSSRTFQVLGVADVDPGTYQLQVTFSDGPGNAADVQRSLTITVVKDAATLTYIGPTTGTGEPLKLGVTVEDDDGTPGVPTGTVAFTDQTTGDALCSAPVTQGDAACTIDAPTDRTYEVVATLTGARYEGASEPATVVVTTTPVDTTPPDARITAGPAQDAIVTARDVVLRFASEPGATYTCTLRGVSKACNGGSVTYRNPAAGTQVFSVRATDAAGNADATPATRRFTVPVDDTGFAKQQGVWQRKTLGTAFRGSYLTTKRKGAWLTYRVTGATSLSLVVGTGPKQGRLEVLLGNQRLKAFGTSSATRKQPVVVKIASFGAPRSGVVRVRTLGTTEVRVDGLAVVGAAATGRPSHVSRAGLVL